MKKESIDKKSAWLNLNNILWFVAIVLEWIIIPLYMASMGRELDIELYNKLKNWKYVTNTYYILACLDIVLFGYFVLLYRKKEELKVMCVSVFCCLVQIVLLISKVKL